LDIFGKKYVLLLLQTATPDGLITILTTPSWLPQQFIQHYKMTEKNKPVIIGVIGTILRSPRQYLSNITEKHKIKKLQKKKKKPTKLKKKTKKKKKKKNQPYWTCTHLW
jgi:hypothetical protein